MSGQTLEYHDHLKTRRIKTKKHKCRDLLAKTQIFQAFKLNSDEII